MNFLVDANMAAYSGPGSPNQVLGKSFVWFCVCYLLSGCKATQNISTERKRIFIGDIENTGNWWEARGNCSEDFDGDLYIPITEPVPSDLFHHLERDRYYWVGAMRYSTWRWTVDDSPLYRYSGYSFRNTDEDHWLQDNSVYRCHRYCGTNIRTLGLSRNRCVCLRDDHQASDTSDLLELCPGNLDEICGDANGISVYKLDFNLSPRTNGVCGYARKKTEISIHLNNVFECLHNKKRFACYGNSTDGDYGSCNGDTCVSDLRYQRSWKQADSTCILIKLDRSVGTQLMQMKTFDYNFSIGLFHYYSRKWINGKSSGEYDDTFPFTSASVPKCLTIIIHGKRMYTSWRRCFSLYRSICEVFKYKPSSTTVTSTSSSQPSSPSTTNLPATKQSTQSPTSSDVFTTETYTSTTNYPSTVHVGPTDSNIASDKTRKGVSIGLGICCFVLVLIVLMMIFLMKRQNQLCFTKKEINQQMSFNSATENTTYGLNVPIQGENVARYNITPMDTVDAESMSSAVPMSRVRPRVQTDNIYDKTSQIDDNDAGDYTVIAQYDNLQAPVTDGNPYNHLSRPAKDTNEGDTAQTGGKGAGSTRLNNAGLSAVGQNPEDDYNVLGQHDSARRDAEVYDHMTKGEGVYDTAHRGKIPREVDDSYSHIGRTNKGFEDDVASTKQAKDRRDDTYNHTATVNENAGDATDYYNTRSLVGDNNESLGRQGETPEDTGIYSLAKGLSDA